MARVGDCIYCDICFSLIDPDEGERMFFVGDKLLCGGCAKSEPPEGEGE